MSPNESPARKGRIGLIVKLTISAALIYALFREEGFGMRALRLLLDVRWQALLSLITLSLLVNWVSAVKWFLILRSRGAELSLTRLFGVYLIGKFFSNFAPGMIGGDMMRAVIIGRSLGSYAQAAASILLERFTGLVALLLLAAVTVLALPAGGNAALQLSVMAALTVGTAAIVLVFLDTGRNLLFRVIAPLPGGQRITSKLASLHAEMAFMVASRNVLFATLALSVVFYTLAGIALHMSCLAVSAHPNPLDVAIATPAIYLVTTIPVSLNNIGWWEWVVGLFLRDAGLTIAAGIAVGLLMRAVSLCVSLIGGVLFLVERWHTAPASQR
jgi:hypothetical protein